MIDWSNLLARPAMAAFAQPITVDPRASQPTVAPYPARGVYDSRAVDIAEPDGSGIMVTQVITLGIRLADFAVPPAQRDRITIGAITFAVSDPPRLDGHGGADLTLKSLGAAT